MQKKFIDKIYIKLRNIVTKYRRSNFFLQKVSICSKHVMLFLICDKMLHCTTKKQPIISYVNRLDDIRFNMYKISIFPHLPNVKFLILINWKNRERFKFV